MDKQDKFGQTFKVGDYIAQPTKYGSTRAMSIGIVAKITPKALRVAQVTRIRPEGVDSLHTVSNYQECLIINKLASEWLGV